MRPTQPLNRVQVSLMKEILKECISKYGANYTYAQYLEVKYDRLRF